MATLKGTWRFNEVLSAPSGITEGESIEQEISFTLSTTAPDGVIYALSNETVTCGISDGAMFLAYYVVSSTPDMSDAGINLPDGIAVYYSTSGWLTQYYGEGIQTITITEDTEVSHEFYAWFTANAVEVVEHTVSGVWKFKDKLSVPSEELYNRTEPLQFACEVVYNGNPVTAHCSTVTFGTQDNGDEYTDIGLWYHVNELNTAVQVANIDLTNGTFAWFTAEYGEGVKTIDFGTEPQTVSAEFYEWLTANATQPTAKITYNGSVIANLFGGQTATLKCKGDNVKMLSDIVVEVAEQTGGGNANIVPLVVGTNVTFNENSPVIITETFTGEGEPDALFSLGSNTIPMFKAKKLIATSDVAGAISTGQVYYEMGGEKVTLSANDIEVSDTYIAMFYTAGVPLSLWLISPDEYYFTAEQGFEPNTAYIADVWSLLGIETGTPLAVTSLGRSDKPIDGYMPVTVALPIQEELTVTPTNNTQWFEQERSGVYYKNVTVKAVPERGLTVKPSFEEQTFVYSKDDNGNGLNSADWKWFYRVVVEPIDLSQTKLLCDIELTSLPKTEYVLGEVLSSAGGIITRHYTDGTTAVITLVNGYIGGYGAIDKAGTYTLYVVYKENGITCRTFYNITVTE